MDLKKTLKPRKPERRICKSKNLRYRMTSCPHSYENAKDTSGMAVIMAQECRAQPGDAIGYSWHFLGKFPVSLQSPGILLFTQCRKAGPYMDKTSSPESLLWVISVVPKRHQTVFQQSHAPFIHYILLFTGQGYVRGEEETSAREKNNPYPSCYHF